MSHDIFPANDDCVHCAFLDAFHENAYWIHLPFLDSLPAKTGYTGVSAHAISLGSFSASDAVVPGFSLRFPPSTGERAHLRSHGAPHTSDGSTRVDTHAAFGCR
jgi:hypothetical protein